MKVFYCSHCPQMVFFENSVCVQCGHLLAYLPDLNTVGSLDPAGQDTWTSPLSGQRYRLCQNYTRENVCNWAIPASEPHSLCKSCRLTPVIPDLSVHREAWGKLEIAKRRLLYSLIQLGCPVESQAENPGRGLAIQFLSDAGSPDGSEVMTGHANGVITVNVAEADDVERERRRIQLHEPYRTIAGHLRHETGHHYWERLISGSSRIEVFRERFGDEREDYNQALQRHYENGPPPDWQQRFVSAYASSHPWEDWAETWAHYLHITDAVETAASSGLSLRFPGGDGSTLGVTFDDLHQNGSFDRLIQDWIPLTYVLNNLNRGLGLPDGYPFILSKPAIEKLRFVHDTIRGNAAGSS